MMLFGMTTALLLVVILALLAGGYMAWNIGANDVANSMSTAVGANAITLRQAVVIASVLNFIGAVFLGSHVTETVKGGIVDTTMIGSAHSIMLGFLAAILAASFFVTVATWLEIYALGGFGPRVFLQRGMRSVCGGRHRREAIFSMAIRRTNREGSSGRETSCRFIRETGARSYVKPSRQGPGSVLPIQCR